MQVKARSSRRMCSFIQILTGEGLFGQINAWTGVPKPVVAIFLLGTIVNNAIAAAHPSSPTFSKENQNDVAKRNKVPTSCSACYCVVLETCVSWTTRLCSLGYQYARH